MNRKFAVIMTFTIFWFSIILLCSYSQAAPKIYPLKDSYVDSYEPLSNYGGQSYMGCGYWGIINIHFTEAYIYFRFNEISEGWSKVELFLNFWLVSQTVQFDIIRISESWNEYSITFVNKPSHDTVLTSIVVLDDGGFTVDVSEYIQGTNFSICISPSIYPCEYVWISSREDSWESDRPRLIFTYPTEEALRFDYFNRWIWYGVPALLVISLIIWAIFNQRKKRRTSTPPITPQPVQQTMQQRNTYYRYCPDCGKPISFQGDFCTYCGDKLE